MFPDVSYLNDYAIDTYTIHVLGIPWFVVAYGIGVNPKSHKFSTEKKEDRNHITSSIKIIPNHKPWKILLITY